MCTYDPVSHFLFTHKLLSAHVCKDSVYDVGGWDVYGEDWRFFYDCMVAPAPKQAQICLDKLPVVAQFMTPSYAGKRGIDIVNCKWEGIRRNQTSFIVHAAWTRRSKGSDEPSKKKSWGQRTDKYMRPFMLDVYISKRYVSCKVTNKVVAVATTNARDLRESLRSLCDEKCMQSDREAHSAAEHGGRCLLREVPASHQREV